MTPMFSGVYKFYVLWAILEYGRFLSMDEVVKGFRST